MTRGEPMRLRMRLRKYEARVNAWGQLVDELARRCALFVLDDMRDPDPSTLERARREAQRFHRAWLRRTSAELELDAQRKRLAREFSP